MLGKQPAPSVRGALRLAEEAGLSRSLFILQYIQNGGETGSEELTVDCFCLLRKNEAQELQVCPVMWVLVGTS